ncbi:MAG TPA: CerR family C-terminal domain-containing protein [Rhizobiaceae bacterium]|nr:CerR family C-terminal domain-containing protein [Rhizobiaceae bacterium]
MTKSPSPSARSANGSSAEQTRLALIQAALRLFGTKGYDGTSTREIAAAAKANIGSIAYHFGGKDGLRAACAQHIVDTVRGVAAKVLAPGEDAGPLTPDAAHKRIETALDTMVSFIIARPEAGEFVQFLLRELAQPTPALDIIYNGVFVPVHSQLCRVWEAATGEPAESERTRITVFTLIGQVVYFRIGRLAVMRRMGWDNIGAQEAGAIVSVVKDNLAAIIASRGKEKP